MAGDVRTQVLIAWALAMVGVQEWFNEVGTCRKMATERTDEIRGLVSQQRESCGLEGSPESGRADF